MNIFMILSAILGWVQCTPTRKIWMPNVPGTCWNPNTLLTYNIFAGGEFLAADQLITMEDDAKPSNSLLGYHGHCSCVVALDHHT
jgi:hypothetical protein